MRFISYLTISILLLAACNNEKVEEKLFADYMVRYLSDTRELSAKAKYKKIKIGEGEEAFLPKEGVRFENKPMIYKAMQGVTADYFSFEKKIPEFPTSLSFQFSDHVGQLIEHSMVISPMKNVKIPTEQIDLDSGFALIWEGESLSIGEELSLIIEQDGITPLRMNKVGSTQSNSIFIRKEQLISLTSGNATITLVQKKYQRYPKESAVGGSSIIEYYHPKINIDIK